MTIKPLSTQAIYAVGGIFFGLIFPITSQCIDGLLRDLPFVWSSVATIHHQNVIHYIVDTAPIVLGFAGWMLGKSYQRKNDINERLQKINDSLDIMTYKITHDLRGPAMNIQGLAEILKSSKGALPKSKQDEVVNRLYESIESWLHIFEDFTALLKQEKSGQKERNNCVLQDTISSLRDELSHEIKQSNATIHENFSACPSVYASPDDLNSIFKNLLTNAIKYAHPARSPEIKIKSENHDKYAKVTVSDNGSGINLVEYGDKLFEIFERLHEDVDVPGSGIGLYLVKEQIEKNNGTIEVESILNEGTIFTIYLPNTPE